MNATCAVWDHFAVVAESAELPRNEDGIRKLSRALKGTALVVGVAFAAAMGLTAAIFDPHDEFGSDEATRAIYQSGFAPGGEVTDVACEESGIQDSLWRCAYERDGRQCVGFVAEGRGFDPASCARP